MRTEETERSPTEARWLVALGCGVLLGAWLATQVDPRWIAPTSLACVILGLVCWVRKSDAWA